MRALYQTLYNKISTIDFAKIDPEFHPFEFALYNENTVYLREKEIPWDDRFRGNTAIEYEGEYIAIWTLTLDDLQSVNIDILAAGLIHEMYHAFQFTKGTFSFPDDRKLLLYPNDLKNYQLKFVENQILSKACFAEKEEQLKLYQKFLSIRKMRQNIIGDYLSMELLVEGVEGSAEYVGSMGLLQMDPKLFQKRIEDYRGIISNLYLEQFDIRRMAYYVGTLRFYVENALKKNDLGTVEDLCIRKNASDEPDFCEEKSLFHLEELSDSESEIADLFTEYISEKQKKIDFFLTDQRVYKELKSMICGYDPMNMIRLGDLLLCTHFVAFLVNGQAEFHQGPILVKMAPDSASEIEGYYE